MFLQLLIGTGMIGLTVIVHALSLDAIIRHLRWLEKTMLHKVQHLPWKPFTIAAVVLAIFAVGVVEMWAWAGLYFFIDALPDFETALYFSTTAFTTIGFGDVMPVHDWRLLGAIEGANGFMLFGWTRPSPLKSCRSFIVRKRQALNSISACDGVFRGDVSWRVHAPA